VSLPLRSTTVVAQPLDEGAVLFCTRTEVYFGLNGVGQLIWDTLGTPGSSFSDLERLLTERYPDVSPSNLAADARDFLNALNEAGLVESVGAPTDQTFLS
jgi:hypothetical protein